MKLFIDGEWDGYKGDLISFALVAEDGSEWYEVLDCSAADSWVIQNVIPKLNRYPKPLFELQNSLRDYLNQFDSVHIIADWPEDIAHFCDLLIIGAGIRIDTPPLTMEVLRVDSISENPHNALADAKGLMNHILSKGAMA